MMIDYEDLPNRKWPSRSRWTILPTHTSIFLTRRTQPNVAEASGRVHANSRRSASLDALRALFFAVFVAQSVSCSQLPMHTSTPHPIGPHLWRRRWDCHSHRHVRLCLHRKERELSTSRRIAEQGLWYQSVVFLRTTKVLHPLDEGGRVYVLDRSGQPRQLQMRPSPATPHYIVMTPTGDRIGLLHQCSTGRPPSCRI